MGKNKIEEDLLLAIEHGADAGFGAGGALFAGKSRQRIGDVCQDVEEVAFFSVDARAFETHGTVETRILSEH